MPKWTREQAVAFAEKGRAAQARMRIEHAGLIATALRLGASGDTFQTETIARVRALVAATLDRLTLAKDPKDVELLSRAVATLAETERKLAGRPLPGTRRNDGPAPAPPRQTLPEPRSPNPAAHPDTPP